MVISNLIKCVSSAKEYLDYFVTIPMAELSNLPFSTWYQLILTVFVLYRLSVGLPEVPEWNVEIAQSTMDLQDYLDTLSSHLKIIKPSTDRQTPTKSLFSRLHDIIGSVRTSYKSAKENPTQAHDSRNAHHELLASMNKGPSTQKPHRCPGLRYSSGHVARPPDHPILQSAIATEVQKIEYDQLWGEVMLMDTFPIMTGSSSPRG